ncbi:MAG: haloacid dehalogenase type II, partial [Gammaproteobacteria bacterium]
MSITLGFDIYGTLIDTHGVTAKLAEITQQPAEFSRVWREKQLEYTFRRGLMRCYQNFAVCTRNALDYTDSLLNTALDDNAKQVLMNEYRVLPAFEDVPQSLALAKEAGFRLFAFSNGLASAVEGLLQHAGISDYFEGVVSVDEVQTFKPNPEVYHHFIKATETTVENAWLVSSNPFDVMGAVN